MNKSYYRPLWTCGRYNRDGHAAIYYNNLAGFSFYFEDVSADVIGAILNYDKGSEITSVGISESLGISENILIPFLEELVDEGLLTTSRLKDEEISLLRKQSSQMRLSRTSPIEYSLSEKLPMDFSSAEMLYTEKAGAVASVMFELTYRCSEKCIHCYNIGATRNDNEVSHRAELEELALDEYKRVIDELYELGLYKVCFTGGDPFSNKNIWDLLDYIYQKDIAFDIFTNGQMLKDVKKLADYFPRSVGISIYSGIAKDHDIITRVPGSWEKSMHILRELSALSVPLELKCCIMQPNFKSYYTVYDICKEVGAAPQMEINISDSIEGDRCARLLRLTPEQLEVVLRDENLKLYVGKEAPNYGGYKKSFFENGCGAGDNTFCLTPDGFLLPCCAFHLHYGNVRDISIRQILETSENKKYWNNLNLAEYDECGKYDYCDYCNLCPGINMSEHGTPVKAAENNCYMAKVRYNLAMKMKDEDYDPLQGKSMVERISEFSDYHSFELKRTIIKHN